MSGVTMKEYRNIYYDFLMNDILPYWQRHGRDTEYGGFLNCMKDDGTILNEDKYMWSQGRGLWTFAHVYRHYNESPEMRTFVEKTCRFLVDNAYDENGDIANRISRTGERLDGPTSIYSDIFTGMGLVEYSLATGDREMLDRAADTARRIAYRIQQPDFNAVAPFSLKPGYHLQGVLFLSINLLTPLLTMYPDKGLEAEAARCVRLIREKHMDRDRELNIEMLDPDYNVVDFPQGRDYVPGHGVECAWLLMLEARRLKDDALMKDALDILRWHLEKGWDEECGGLFWWLNIDGVDPYEENWQCKLWWPHSESLLALMLAYEYTGESYWLDWFTRMHEYSFRTFSDPDNGEWRQRLDRHGNPIEKTLVLPVKDPFHLPRAIMGIIESIERQLS